MTKHYYSYLALGDSYTIGEGLPLYESYPYQVLQLLRKKDIHMHAPEVIARTGWTSTELAEHLLHTRLNEQYDFVTLSIGVNNQYRGLDIDDYKNDVEFLLHKAIHFAGEKQHHVIVLSIPDWSVTPFAKDRKQQKIAEEINAFNQVNRQLADLYKVRYIDVTQSSRSAAIDQSLLAADQLHYSSLEYAKWARQIASLMEQMITAK